jgi:hypothetical protein
MNVVINGYTGNGWYCDGQKRLRESLQGMKGFELSFSKTNLDTNPYFLHSCPYTVKAAEIYTAIHQGATRILWLDCSIWAIKDIQPIFDIIERDGYYFIKSGYNCAQTSNDKALEYFNISRNTAEHLPEIWSCVFGLDLSNLDAEAVCELFLQSAKDGIFNGPRHHGWGSKDPRFLFHRQDQTCLSLAVHTEISNPILHDPTEHLCYVGQDWPVTNTTIFKMKGM